MRIALLLILIWGCAETEKRTSSYSTKKTAQKSPAIESVQSDALIRESLARSEGKVLRDYVNDPESGISAFCYDGNYNKAFNLADEIYDSFKKNPGYWNQIGNCYYLKKDYKKAILFYNKAKGLNPNFLPAVNNLGVVFQAQGDFKKALFFYKSAVNLGASSRVPRFNLASLYLKFGIVSKGCSIFNALSGASPMDPDILNAKGSCSLFNGNYSMAVSDFKKIPEDLLDKGYIGINYSLALGLLGRKSEALEVHRKVKDIGNQRNYYRSVGDFLNRM